MNWTTEALILPKAAEMRAVWRAPHRPAASSTITAKVTAALDPVRAVTAGGLAVRQLVKRIATGE